MDAANSTAPESEIAAAQTLLRDGLAALTSSGLAPVARADALARLVDRVLVETHTAVVDRFVAQHGRARRSDGRPCPHVVFALGPYGRSELAFPHAQLLFVYATDEGASEGAHGLSPKLDLHTYHGRLFAALARALSDVQVTVDLDLRPEGPSGPLCNSLDALESYYESFGHALDRKYLASARAVAGDTDFGAEILASLAPFVFRRAIDSALTADLRIGSFSLDPPHRHQFDWRQVGHLFDDLLDTLCLGFGGRFPALRSGNTPTRLAQLARHRLLSDVDSARLLELHEALLVSASADPDASPSLGLELLATLNDLIAALPNSAPSDDPGPRGSGPERARDTEDPALALALTPSTAGHLAAQRFAALAALGFARPELAAERLDILARHPESPFHRRHAFASPALAPVLLRAAARSSDPDQALSGIETLVHQLRHQTHAAAQLALDERRVERLIALFATDPSASRQLLGSSALVSRLVLEGERFSPRSRDDLMRQLLDTLAVGSDHLAAARRFHTAELTRIAYERVVDPAFDAGRERASLAEALIIGLACVVARVTSPLDLPFAIIARGPLAAGHLDEHAALDLEFVTRHADSHEPARLARRLVTALTAPTAEGTLYTLAPPPGRPVSGRIASASRFTAWLRDDTAHEARAFSFRVLAAPADLAADLEAFHPPVTALAS